MEINSLSFLSMCRRRIVRYERKVFHPMQEWSLQLWLELGL